MSTSASFDFRVIWAGSRELVEPVEIVKKLAEGGWSFIFNGCANYLPIGDVEESFNWTNQKINFNELLEILIKKQERKELVGVFMTWEDTDIGGDLLMWGASQAKTRMTYEPIGFSASSNRQIFNQDYPRTNVNWYLERLLPIFDTTDTLLESYTFTEHL